MIRPKLIYLARRNPALTRESFIPRWRQHGALGISMPRWKNIWRYGHCDVLADGQDVPGIRSDFDGVGIVWHRSPDARRMHREDQSSQAAMERDELETFSELVRNFCALYEAQLIVDLGTGSVKLFRFLKRQAHVDPAEFFDQMATVAPDLLLRDAGARDVVRRYVQNRRLPPEARAWGLDYDLVEELWFDSAEDAIHAQSLIGRNAPLNRLVAGMVAESVALLTNEVILYEAPE